MKRIALIGTLDEAQGERVVAEIQAAAGQPVDLRIDSPGGKLGVAIDICLEMEEHDRLVITTITGEAYSAAGLVAMAGDRRRIVRGALMLVHHAQPYSMRTSDELAGAISEFTGQPQSAAWRWMNDEKIFDATEAKAAGLVDTIVADHLTPTVFLKEPPKRRPAAWLRSWREFYETHDLRV
jgi:ATP-dependent protease ClpP protease subunit